MTSHAYDYHEDYYSINTGAHRKGGLELDTPTLSHHLGLWHPRQVPDADVQRSVSVYGKLVDSYVAAHYKSMRNLDGFEQNFAFHVDGTDVIALFGGAYHAADPRALQPFEINASREHFVLKDAVESETRILFMKARWHGLRLIVRCEFHSEYFTITRTATVVDSRAIPAEIGDLEAALSGLAGLDIAPERTMTIDACNAFLYRSVWDALDERLFDCASLLRAQHVGRSGNRVFADFRGLVLSGDDTLAKGGLSLGGIEKGNPFQRQWPVDVLFPSLWRFLTVERGLDLKRREFTASFMLRQRAVYITALGPQPPADGGFVCAPLNYLLVARPISDWQLGTLVDRLHFMGTVRLAALMELPALRQAGANLRATEHEAEKAREALDAKWTRKAITHYRRAQDLVAHTDREKQPIFWEGLQYRVERSRYYVQRFDDFSHFLEMSPIEGFQQYDHFVRARLGFNYDYIDRLGRRQDRAVRGIAGLWQSISLNENGQTSRTIEKLQTKAEIALLAVILPHYLIEMINDMKEGIDLHGDTLMRWDKAIVAVGALFAGMSLSTYVYEIYRAKDFDRLRDMARKYSILIVFSVALMVFIVHK